MRSTERYTSYFRNLRDYDLLDVESICKVMSNGLLWTALDCFGLNVNQYGFFESEILLKD
jgi:hypothetical protein